MGRILFWLLLGLVAYISYRWWRIKQLGASGAAGARRKLQAETMVRCEVCGLNVPQSDAVGAAGRWYCGEDHRRRGQGEV